MLTDHTEVEDTKIKGIESGRNAEDVVARITKRTNATIVTIVRCMDMKLPAVMQSREMKEIQGNKVMNQKTDFPKGVCGNKAQAPSDLITEKQLKEEITMRTHTLWSVVEI